MAAEFLRLMPRYVAGAGCAAGAAVVIGRYFDAQVSWQAVAIAGAGLAISGAAVHAAAKRWTIRKAAERADSVLGLHDQIGNAIELAEQDAGGFGVLAIAAGEKAAATVDVSRTVSLRWWSRWWTGSAAAAGLAVAAWFYSPVRTAETITSQDAMKALDDARKIAEAQPPKTAEQAVEQPKPELQELAQIEKELAQGTMSPNDAATRAASVLERVADERAKSADDGKAQSEKARESLAQAAKPASDKSPADSSPLRKALQAGDLDAAAAEAQKLAENAERLTPDERSLLESDLRDLAHALDEQARESAAEAAKLQEEAREARENSPEPSKPDASSEDSAAKTDSQARENPPEDANKAISDAARQAAEDLKQKPESAPEEKRNSDPNADKGDSQSPKNGDTKKDESKSSEESPSDAAKSGEPKQGDSAKSEQKSGEKTGDKSTEKPGDAAGKKPELKSGLKPGDKTGDKAGGKPVAKSGEKDGQKTDGQSSSPPRDSGKPEDKAQAGDNKPGDNAAPNQKDQTGKPDQNKPGQQQGETPKGQQPDSANADQKSNSGKPTAGEKPGQNGSQPGNEQPKSGSDQPQGNSPDGKQGTKEGAKDGSGTGLQKLARELKDLQQKSKDAASNERSSRQMREQARKILENMDPAQRRELQRQLAGAGKGEGEGNGPGDQPPMLKDPAAKPPEWSGASKIVDFRTKPGNAAAPGKERVISDWQKEMPDGRRDASQAASAMEEDIRQARESAERAIEQQSVPAQHRDLVRRVFEKFNQRIDTAKKSAPAATPAPDAKPAGGGGR